MQTVSCPRLSGKVSALADERGKLEQKRKRILTCVRKHAPFASQARHFPPSSGEADAKEERNHIFI